MSDAVPFWQNAKTGPDTAGSATVTNRAAWHSTLVRIVLAYALATAAFLILRHVFSGTDYVGADNDDVMRLVEVRDLLDGQSWFDMHQYRLGLAGGTLMHWSRFIDLPIAALVAFFSLFVKQTSAEAAALIVWPSLTIVPLFAGMGLAGWRLSGRSGAHIALGLTALYIVCINRFQPGAIDHHNVQMGLIALMGAMLVDRTFSPRSFAIAGFCAGLAIAIGAETIPHVAVVCALVAALWAWEGAAMVRAAQAFGLVLAATLTVAFFTTTPPSLYSTVRCDALSVGFYTLGTIGGGLLFCVAATAASRSSRTVRFGILALCGMAIAGLVLLITPECLRGPYADLDPLLVHLWLDHVTETRSVFNMLAYKPYSIGAFYAVPIIAAAVCIWRIARDDRRALHLTLLALVAASFAITLVQLRGSMFSTVLAIVPLAAMIADLRARSAADTRNVKIALAFIVFTLVSAPPFWAFAGGMAKIATDGSDSATPATSAADCKTKQVMAPLAGEPVGLVTGPSNMGVSVLRYTDQRVLTAPYHRNPKGMLDALKIEMASPVKAEALMRQTGVTIFALCTADPETRTVSDAAPDGLLARMAGGYVPSYLRPVRSSLGKTVEFFRFAAGGR